MGKDCLAAKPAIVPAGVADCQPLTISGACYLAQYALTLLNKSKKVNKGKIRKFRRLSA
jgi:hypothetical protein